jgi:hypothetical protein
MLGRAELVLDLDRPGEIAMQRVVHVDPDTAVQVLAGEGGGLPALGGPELRHGDVLFRGSIRGKAPDRLQGGEPDRLDVDVGIGGTLMSASVIMSAR